MKQLAKICLNSLWGKFAQHPVLDSYEYINNGNRLIAKMCDAKVNINTWYIIKVAVLS